MTDQQDGRKKRESSPVILARYSEIAFIIPAGVVAGLLMGKLADHLLHTHWLTVVGIIIGAIAGFMQLIRMVMREKD